jgi:predicted ATPase
MIKKIEVSGLPRQSFPLNASFNSDLNIITGRNGSGKTTLLKLLWYVISGNIQHALHEVPFSRVYVETDDYSITVHRAGPMQCRIEFCHDGEESLFEDGEDYEEGYRIDAEELGNNAVKDIGSSLFFPTFRRIEGGFTIGRRTSAPSPFRPSSRPASEIEEALASLSRRMSIQKHTFVSAISTADIVTLLMRNYTEMSELANNMQKDVSQKVIDQIKNYEGDSNIRQGPTSSEANHTLSVIKSMIESMEETRKDIMAPLEAVRNVVESLFRNSGIKLGTRISFGDAANAVSSDLLSAGEKQMLSFICYNAFYKNSVIFIDEPELSLHIDWQRQLFPILEKQGTSNQFIIATHSPFIYSKYPDREIIINEDKGHSSLDID